jgi:hypothetical protein
MNVCFYDLFHCILCLCTLEVLELFTLSMFLLFDFISFLLLSCFLDIISFFIDEVPCSFSIEYFQGIFCSRLIFCESLEAVIFSEGSEGSIVPLVHKQDSVEISNTFWGFIIDVKSTQTRAILGGAVSIAVYFHWCHKWRTKIQVLYCGWKDKYPLTQKYLNLQPRKQFYSNKILGAPIAISSNFTSCGFVFEITLERP